MEAPGADRVPFEVLVDRTGNRVLLALSGEFGLEAGRLFEDAVQELQRGTVRELTLDLSGITFMDTAGALMLLDLHRRFSVDGRVTLEGASPEVQRVFESAGMSSVLTLPAGAGTDPAGVHIPGPEHDVSSTPGHPHHPHPYIGLPRREMPPRRRS